MIDVDALEKLKREWSRETLDDVVTTAAALHYAIWAQEWTPESLLGDFLEVLLPLLPE